jgi:hypothetical protein
MHVLIVTLSLLSDNRMMKVIRQLDQKWYITNVLPRTLENTISHNAIIVSEDIFT